MFMKMAGGIGFTCMSEAFQCDFCGDYKDGEPSLRWEHPDRRGIMIHNSTGEEEFCFTCKQKLMVWFNENSNA